MLQKATKAFMTLSSQRDQLQLLPHVETSVIQLTAGLYPRRLQTLLQSFLRVSGQLLLCRTLPRALLQHPPYVLQNDTAVNLLFQSIAKSWAYMDTSSPSPAATDSLAALATLLGNFKGSLWRKAVGLGQH